jgi:hypothetical protein
MPKSDKLDIALKAAAVAFWVFVIGMAVTNDWFRHILLNPLAS